MRSSSKGGFLIGFILILVLVAGGAAAPYFMGKIVHKQYIQFVNQISTLPGVSAKSLVYKSGYLSSTAKTKLVIDESKWVPMTPKLINADPNQNITVEDVSKQLKSESEPKVLVLEHTLHHGPLVQIKTNGKTSWKLAQAVIDTQLNEETKQKYFNIQDVKDFLTINAFFDVKGALDINIINKPYSEFDQNHGFAMEWGGLTARFLVSSNLKKINGVLVAPKFKWFDKAKNILVSISDYVVDIDINKNNGLYWVGDNKMSFSELKFASPQWKTSLDAISFANSSSSSKGLSNAVFSIGAEEIQSYGVDGLSGYGQRLRNFDFKLGIYNIADALVKKIDDAAKYLESVENDQKISAQSQIMNTFTLDDFKLFLANKPKLSINNFEFYLPEGKFSGSANIQLDSNQVINSWDELPKIMQDITAVIQFKADKDVLLEIGTLNLEKFSEEKTNTQQMIQAQLDELVKAGFLKLTDKVYDLDFSYTGGKTLFHGKELNPMFLPMPMPMPPATTESQ